MTVSEGSSLAGNPGRLLQMYLAIEDSKDAIGEFESGEINADEAIRRLTEAANSHDAGA